MRIQDIIGMIAVSTLAAVSLFLWQELQAVKTSVGSQQEVFRKLAEKQAETSHQTADIHAAMARLMLREDRATAGQYAPARLQLAQDHDSTIDRSVVFDSADFVTQDQLEDALDDLRDYIDQQIANQPSGSGQIQCLNVSGIIGVSGAAGSRPQTHPQYKISIPPEAQQLAYQYNINRISDFYTSTMHRSGFTAGTVPAGGWFYVGPLVDTGTNSGALNAIICRLR